MSSFFHRKKSPVELVKSTKKHIELLQNPHTMQDEKLAKKVRQTAAHSNAKQQRADNREAEKHCRHWREQQTAQPAVFATRRHSRRVLDSYCAARAHAQAICSNSLDCACALCATLLFVNLSAHIAVSLAAPIIASRPSVHVAALCVCALGPVVAVRIRQSMEKISLNLSNMKFMLYGDAENEPKEGDMNKLVEEVSRIHDEATTAEAARETHPLLDLVRIC